MYYSASFRATSAVPPTASNPVPRRIAKFIAASPPAPVFGKPGVVELAESDDIEPEVFDEPFVDAPELPFVLFDDPFVLFDEPFVVFVVVEP